MNSYWVQFTPMIWLLQTCSSHNPLFYTICHLSSLNKTLEVALQQKNLCSLSTMGNKHALNYSVGADFSIHLILWHFEHIWHIFCRVSASGMLQFTVILHFEAQWTCRQMKMHSVFAVMGSLPKWLGFGQAVEVAVSIRSKSSKVRT